MNRIYFLNKGHVRRASIPNIWPYKHVHSAPVEFFNEPGLTLILNPKLVQRRYFLCEIYAIDNRSAELVEFVTNRPYLRYHVPLSATYNKYNNGYLHMESGKDIKDMTPDHRNYHARTQHAALDLLYEGVKEFEKYFIGPIEQQE